MTFIAPQAMICGNCHRPLEEFTDAAGNSLHYQHSAGIAGGAKCPGVAPVPRTGAQHTLTLCDFCVWPGPTWRYPVISFKSAVKIFQPERNRMVSPQSHGDWLACEDCHADIEANRWEAILDRYGRNSTLPREARRKGRKDVARYHQEFRHHKTGPATPYIDG